MSLQQQAMKQATWFAFFRLITQGLSWASTVIVARILVPGDYGLMDMATILTGYAMLFSELGLGSAIIQHQNSTHKQHSELFWFTTGLSLFFIALCFILAYPTAAIFKEPRVIPLTQAVSLIFLFNGLTIVPQNILRKEIRFKDLGIIDMVSTLVSCVAMIGIANIGWGVWTLLLGHIIRSIINCILSFYILRWVPGRIVFDFKEIKEFITFGIAMALGRTFLYLFQKADRFFAGLFYNAEKLGFYSFAMLLASIPTDKVLSMIFQVSYPMFAKVQNDKPEFRRMYISINKIIFFVSLPLFAGGYLVGEDLIRLVFEQKWVPIISLFQYLCLAQIFVALAAVNNNVHAANGEPKWSTVFNGVCAILMSISFYFAAKHSLDSLLIPWFTTYPVIAIAFIIFTLKRIELPIFEFVKHQLNPVLATFSMAAIILLLDKFVLRESVLFQNGWVRLSIKSAIGALWYASYFFLFDRGFLFSIKRLLGKKKVDEPAQAVEEVAAT